MEGSHWVSFCEALLSSALAFERVHERSQEKEGRHVHGHMVGTDSMMRLVVGKKTDPQLATCADRMHV